MTKKKKNRGGCYHCGLEDHRAKECPQSTCRQCGDKGHGVSACPTRQERAVDLGQFEPAPDTCKFRYIELFAGIGGFRVALDRLGGHCVFASEIDRFARANYELNHSDRLAGDITKISEDVIPDHDLLVGGFPCQAFSSSGERKGFEDERGVLFLEIVRIVKRKQPKAVLLENVRGLLTHDDGKTLQVILSTLEESGYVMKYQVLDAVHLVPQERKRIYLVGIRKDLWVPGGYEYPRIPPLKRGFMDIMEVNMNAEMVESLSLSDHQLGKVRNQKYTQKFPEARFLSDLAKPTKTLQSSYASYMVGSQFVPVESNADDEGDSVASLKRWRKLSPREAARLQGFPETIQLCTARPYRLLGNAVVPSMIALVAAPLLKLLDPAVETTDCMTQGVQVATSLLLEASPGDERAVDLRKKIDTLTTRGMGKANEFK
jgi:DNA (cytosine-5)-methyltransferase 1